MAKSDGGTKTQTSSEHQQLLALINNMADGFIAIDALGKITLSNSSALGLLNAHVLNGKRLQSVIDIIDKDGYPIDIQKLILTNTSGFTNRDWQLRYKDNATINIQLNVSPVRLGYGKENQGGYVILIRDITVEKLLEEERDEFVSVAGHELRTPVAIAEGSISNARLIAERDKVSDPVKHSLAVAHEQVLFLSSLINDLAMLSRADNDKAAQSVETFDPGELIASLMHDYKPQATQKKLTLKENLSDDLQLLTANRLYVHEILQNFITNALKYTEKGSVTLSAEPETNGVVFSVADTGIGIDQNEHTKLFTKFFRSEDWRVRQITGTGLGLYVSAKLAKILGAKIETQSELNKGSTFRLHVPNMVKDPTV